MPELPEVEVVRQGLAPLLINRRITGFHFSNKKLRHPVPKSLLSREVKGFHIKEVDRRAKYLLVYMENDAVVVFHLGMTGRLGLFPQTEPILKHDHVRIRLDTDMELRFHDSRRFGSIRVIPPGMVEDKLFKNIGPEPFDESFSPVYLSAKAKNRTQPVKNFLMDGRIVAGIGNIYASEILFRAGIRPTRATGKITKPQWGKIIKYCHEVLREAIRAGGTTIADYVNASGQKGYFQMDLMVYGRDKEACRKCNALINKIVQAGRASYFCKRCQK